MGDAHARHSTVPLIDGSKVPFTPAMREFLQKRTSGGCLYPGWLASPADIRAADWETI